MLSVRKAEDILTLIDALQIPLHCPVTATTIVTSRIFHLPALPLAVSNIVDSSTMKHEDYTVGWICALPKEMAAAMAMLDEIHTPLEQDLNDTNNYILGCIGVHNVAVACLPEGVIGTISAARVASQMHWTFKQMRFGLMVGIGGGVPSQAHDIRLGDIVVSKPTGTSGGVIQYDFGKTMEGGQFKRIGQLNKPPEVLLTALSSLKARHMLNDPELSKYLSEMVAKYPKMRAQLARQGTKDDQLYLANYEHQGGSGTCSKCDASKLVHREPRDSDIPIIHYGLIASGNQVMKHAITRDLVGEELDVLCFEMEAAGLMDHFPCLVIRGICDYSDSHKNKGWQEYAAATAAAYAKELLCVIPGNQIIGTRPVAEVTPEVCESAS